MLKRELALSRNDTSVLKGIAICAMLFHHLYYFPPLGVERYSGFLLWLGGLGKVCVSIFLFCSGYGLTSQFSNQKDGSIKGSCRFVIRRFLKFYTNYWTVLLVFVPISIFVFGRTIEIAYAGLNIPKRILYEIFAINGFSSYNITWWFNKVIVILYLLFPLLYWLIEKTGWVFFSISLVVFLFYNHIPGNNTEIYIWQFPFVIGMFWSVWEYRIPNVTEFISKHIVISLVLSFALFVLLVFLRQNIIQGIWLDPVITCVLVLMIVLMNKEGSWLSKGFFFLGKHSMNIYMIHTFFNIYWCPRLLHTTPWMRCGTNFVVLLSICLLISVLLEWMKAKIGIYSAVNKLSERILL